MTAKNRGLGRGLDALFSQSESILDAAEVKKSDGNIIHEIDITLIDVNKDQPRKSFDDQGINELAESIKANGLLQPIVVTKEGERYLIVAGERRYRAFRRLEMEKIPAIIKNLTKQQSMELALIENIQRRDLNSVEEAMALKALMEEFGYTQQQLSDRLGMSRSTLANSLRLLSLSQKVLSLVASGELSSGHARALVVLDENKQLEISGIIIKKGLNVRQTEALVAQITAQKPQKTQKKSYIELRDAENTIREHVGTKVSIKGTPKKGKLIIEYYSQDDLEGILEYFTK
ncbi:MAG: ParB/RepB/Spo0J family partition protein [Clostridia bacterium]|nr:ParB/RepB/Spo0J family partition protein [Clostridia bacterium]